jgi:hypothetical protein
MCEENEKCGSRFSLLSLRFRFRFWFGSPSAANMNKNREVRTEKGERRSSPTSAVID